MTTVTSDPALFVAKNVGAPWGASSGTASRAAYSAYAGQTISNPPTQAEVQAIDDEVKLQSRILVALIADLRANGALST